MGREPFGLRFIKWILLRGILSSNTRTRIVASLLRFYRTSGLQQAVDDSDILSLFSERLQSKHALLPAIADANFTDHVAELVPAVSPKRGTVALLTGCIMNVAFPDIHRDVVNVLTKNGFEVLVPKQQGCCGSLHAHYGDAEEAQRLAKKNIDVFGALGADALIVDSAGCGAFMKEYGHVLGDDEKYAERAKNLSQKTKDITEFLADVGIAQTHARQKDGGPAKPAEEIRVTYHEACHLVHTQKISRQPRDLIRSIPGVEFAELPEATWCCGSAGIYNVVRFDDSMELLDRKMKNLASTQAEIVLTANPGCHLQLQFGIKKFGLKMKVQHPISLISEQMGQVQS
jgi:glycolate oxidase iron-sulfur subunit